MRRTLAALLVLTFLTPAASAWPWDPVTVTVADSRVGDLLRFSLVSLDRAPNGTEERSASTVLARIEGVETIADVFGQPREADAHLIQHVAENGTVETTHRCFGLSGGIDTVRRDPLDDAWSQSSANARRSDIAGIQTGSMSSSRNSTMLSTFASWPCEGRNHLAGRVFREHARVRFGDLMPELDEGRDDALSRPAEETDFHGRTALRFTYDLADILPDQGYEGDLQVIVADGLPGFAQFSVQGATTRDGERSEGRFSHELAGIVPGHGPALARMRGEALSERNPAATFGPWTPGLVPDEAFQLRYPFADAYRAVLEDPQRGLASWLDRHPDARLEWVWYSRDVPQADVGTMAGSVSRCDLDLDGTWWMGFSDGRSAYRADATRCGRSTLPAALAPLAPDAATTSVGGSQVKPFSDEPIAAWPAQIADSQALAAVAAAHGVEPGKVANFAFGVVAVSKGPAYPYLSVSTIDQNVAAEGKVEGIHLAIDPTTGGARAITSLTQTAHRETILDPLGSGGDLGEGDPKLSTLSALAGPIPGAGLGVGAATGLAVLVVLAKFLLFPLFTRLRRDRLLDNPVRARLYERIRAEPGIHIAELTDFLGVGEGATRHHLQQLVRHKLLVEMRDAGFVRYYAAGEIPPDLARRAAALRGGSARAVYDLLASEPHLSLRQAADRLGMSAPSVHRAKKKLEKAGLLPAAPVASGQVAEA